MKAKISLVRCEEYNERLVEGSVRTAINLLGGIQAFIKPGSRVLVKPNLLVAREPEAGITTHPLVVSAVIKILKENDCFVFLGDGPGAWECISNDVDHVYEKTGMKRVAEETGTDLVKFDKRRWSGKFPLTTWLDECDYLVSLPKFKTHQLTTLTAGVKNLYGLVCGTYKAELHKRYFGKEEFSRILVDIYEQVKPTLTIVDGVIAMEGEGPGSAGILREAGLICAGADCVAIDSVLASIMGLEPKRILTNREAANRGLGVANIDAIEILGSSLKELTQAPFKLPASTVKNEIAGIVIKLLKNFIHFYPAIKTNCIKCGTCIKICPNQAISMKAGCVVIDYSKCISCFCCQETCPASAIRIKKSLLARLAGL